jgi:hypothetical protein
MFIALAPGVYLDLKRCQAFALGIITLTQMLDGYIEFIRKDHFQNIANITETGRKTKQTLIYI